VHEIAKIPVVFAVNATVPLKALSESQVCGIYSRQLVNWNQLGGPDLPVAPRTRPDTEVDAEVVRARVPCLKDLQMAESVRSMPKAADMAKELAATAGAIGMTTMTVVEQSEARIRPLALNAVEPNAMNVRSGAYPLTRDSFLITRERPAPAVARFLAFVRSAEGAAVVAANGAIAMN
jgi:phosphate transport system substrate-binding protein